MDRTQRIEVEDVEDRIEVEGVEDLMCNGCGWAICTAAFIVAELIRIAL